MQPKSISFLGERMFAGCSSIRSFVVPSSITNAQSQISPDFLRDSYITRITFLGISSGDSIKTLVIGNKFFSKNSDLDVIMGNGELWKYSSSQNNFYKQKDSSKTWCASNFNGRLDSIENAKKKLKVNRPFKYSGAIADFCFNNKIPLVVIYVDALTSVWSQNIIQTMSESTAKKEFGDSEINGVILCLDRNDTDGTSHFRTFAGNLGQTINKLPFVLFTYNGKTYSDTLFGM